MRKKFSPAIFGLALICFFLPWTTVSCQQQKVMSFTGIQLVTGTTVKQPTMFGQKQARKVKGETYAVIALLAVVAGLVISFLPGKAGSMASALTGGVAAALLLMLKSKLDKDIFREAGGVLQLDYDIGFYLTLILSVCAVAINAYMMVQEKTPPQPNTTIQKTDYKFCSSCGTKTESNAVFCSGCGNPLS